MKRAETIPFEAVEPLTPAQARYKFLLQQHNERKVNLLKIERKRLGKTPA